ncbi:MAG: hypothetical protein COB98_05505 [Flavobacteriaceae bacterium]|nr:MAG: hypothetical protein COB98_05505 [Flavobacteriaceae bacterium]
MKPYYPVFFCLFSIILTAQNSGDLTQNPFQKNDNLEGYIYAQIAVFSTKPSTENLYLFKETEQQLWRSPKTSAEKIAWLHFQIQHAYQRKVIGQLSKSVQIYEKAFHYYTSEQLLHYDILEYCLLPMANNYTKLGAFERSETLLKVAQTMASKQENTRKLAAVYNNLSILYQSKGFYKKAKKLLEKIMGLKDITKVQKGRVLGNLALVELRLNNVEKAVDYAKKSLLINPNNKELAQKLASIEAVYFEKQAQFKAAFSAYKKAQSIALEEKGPKSREFIKSSINLAAFYVRRNQVTRGEKIFLDCLKKQTIPFLTVDNTLKTIHEALGDISNQKGEIKAAIQHYKNGLKANLNLKKTLIADVSKIRLMAENNALSEKIIAAYYLLYQSSKEVSYALAALNISENSKARIVSDQLRQQSIKSASSNLYFKRESTLKLRRSQLLHQRMLAEKNQGTADILHLKNIHNKLNILTNNLQVLTQEIREKHPEIFNTPTEIKQIDLEELLVNEQQLVLEYFVGSESVYVFSIATNRALSFRKIENKDLLQEDIGRFYALFSSDRGRKIQQNIPYYTRLAHQLYLKLLAPELQNHHYTSLVVIPDAAIGLLPFDALLSSPTQHLDFSKMPYLLLQSELTYNTSIQIMRRHKTAPIQHSFTGFFPVFDTKKSKRPALENTITEAENLHKTMGGTIFLRAEASKENFLKQQDNTGILHLATHASSGTFQEPPSIEFSDNTLYLTELYGLRFNTQLIVLSACETNVGPIIKGEGVLSLARGFLYAGVQNSIVSQWEVNDKSTAQLMSRFYIQLKKTSHTAAALQLSKKEYLSDSKIYHLKKSPYYWAGFSYYGQLDNHPNKTSKYWIIGSAFLLLITSFFFYGRKQ